MRLSGGIGLEREERFAICHAITSLVFCDINKMLSKWLWTTRLPTSFPQISMTKLDKVDDKGW
jgi:hypothetical protein